MRRKGVSQRNDSSHESCYIAAFYLSIECSGEEAYVSFPGRNATERENRMKDNNIRLLFMRMQEMPVIIAPMWSSGRAATLEKANHHVTLTGLRIRQVRYALYLWLASLPGCSIELQSSPQPVWDGHWNPQRDRRASNARSRRLLTKHILCP